MPPHPSNDQEHPAGLPLGWLVILVLLLTLLLPTLNGLVSAQNAPKDGAHSLPLVKRANQD